MLKTEYMVFLVTIVLVANTYYDGRLLKVVTSNQKFIKMAMYGFVGLSLFLFIRKNPSQSHQLMYHMNDIIKYMPISKGTADMITPFFDFTRNHGGISGFAAGMTPDMQRMTAQQMAVGGGAAAAAAGAGAGARGGRQERNGLMMSSGESKILSSGKTSSKRCVSETKKKYVAAQQGWTCGDCRRQLPAWFEVDHVIRLEHGGSNHVDNLVALCRDCHGKKTAMENL